MSADLLVEVGTEELPPKALSGLIDAFADGVRRGLDDARLEHGDIHAFATPRRLAVIVERLSDHQPDLRVEHKGPPVSIAFDDAGKPKPAALAFAKKCGVGVDQLDRTRTEKGEWLSFESRQAGEPLEALISGIVESALNAMPIPRRMRWGSEDIEFVRPVHWAVLVYGKKVIDTTILGIETGRATRGHRFQSKGPIDISKAADYVKTLEKKGFVVADMADRRQRIVDGVTAAAKQLGGSALGGDALYDEVNALVEWPVALTGRFEERYLKLPAEVIVSTLTSHQRYFPVEDKDGKLKPAFITVANIDSRDPSRVVDGNERVIRPRLADAEFFWNTDRKTPLEARREALANVVYQKGLGSIADKSQRVATLARTLAEDTGAGTAAVERAAALCKCDLLTGMVGEFPELQGIMGAYYAESDGEDAAVAAAIREHYQPRFSGDELPASEAGRLLAVADRMDTLAGIFALGKKPSGNRDPFGLRRAALGVVRILVEADLAVDFAALVAQAIELQPAKHDASAELAPFILERLRSYCLERGATPQAFDAVLAVEPASLPDFKRRLDAVRAFTKLDEAESLAAANKRIGNILKKSGDGAAETDRSLLAEPAEVELFDAMRATAKAVQPMLDGGDYEGALVELAVLRSPVDRFFDDVMVMSEDRKLRENRLALLGELSRLFSGVADISRLSIA